MSNSLGIIGKKVGMTRIFAEDGSVIPVTVVKAGPCPIIQKKSQDKEGYNAIQLAFEEVPGHRLNKPEQGHLKKAERGYFKHLKEFKVEINAKDFKTQMSLKKLLNKHDKKVLKK